MIKFKNIKWLVPIAVCFNLVPSWSFAANWIDHSNQIAKEFALDDANRYPESASSMGYREYDSKSIQLEDDMESKDVASLERWRVRLNKEIKSSNDSKFELDMKVLLQAVENSLKGKQLSKKYGDIPFYPATKIVFGNLRALVNSQSDETRKRAAIDRFKSYVNGHDTFKPLLDAYEHRVLFQETKHSDKQLYPLKQEVEEYLSESSDYLKGIHELLEQSTRKDWNSDFEKFKIQQDHYDSFIRNHVLPKARTDYRVPTEIYAHILKVRGIDVSPEKLIQMSLEDYKKVYDRFRAVSAQVAKKHELKESDPVSVIHFLKSKQVTNSDEVKKLYQNASSILTQMIHSNDIVSLPKAPLIIRFAEGAESKADPIPRLNPPPLIGNRGERPEFIVPIAGDGKPPFDDFSYDAAALILTAHEGRPGHDLQFSSILDNGVSIVRARYAFNNVNVEGWALYAEDLVYNHLPIESQLVALQFRLWRIARAFLDPQIQLGKIKPEGVIEVFTKELGVSSVMAGFEIKRYTYDDIGQAPSYYYGLTRVRAAKKLVEESLGKKFKDKCFNDGLLSMGLLPIDLAAAELVKNLKCDGK